jgi:5-methylcytosine-specific restriction endonuclease McrA
MTVDKKEKERLKNAAYYKKNREKEIARATAWAKANKERVAQLRAKRAEKTAAQKAEKKEARKILTKARAAAYKKKWKEENRERIKQQNAAYYRANKERHRGWIAAAHKADPTKRRDYAAEYYKRKKEDFAKRAALWRECNPEAARALNIKRRAREGGAKGEHKAADIKRLFDLQKGRCPVCRSDLSGGYHVDHVLPLARGGSNDPTNIQLLCKTCNLSKGAKDPIAFMRQKGFLL